VQCVEGDCLTGFNGMGVIGEGVCKCVEGDCLTGFNGMGVIGEGVCKCAWIAVVEDVGDWRSTTL